MSSSIGSIFYNYCICLNKNNTQYEVCYNKDENAFRVVVNVGLTSDALCNRGSPVISYNVNKQTIYTIKYDNPEIGLYGYLNGIYYIINDINPQDDNTGIFDKYNFYLRLNYYPYGLVKIEYDGLSGISMYINDECIKKNIQFYGINCDKVSRLDKDIHFKYAHNLSLEENLCNFSKIVCTNKIYEINNELSIVSDTEGKYAENTVCASFENNIIYYLYKGDAYIEKNEILNLLNDLGKKDISKLAFILNNVYDRISAMNDHNHAFKSLLNIMLFIKAEKSVLEKKLLFLLVDGLFSANNDEININALMLAEYWGGWRSLFVVNKYMKNRSPNYNGMDYITSYGRNVLDTLIRLQSNLNINDLNDIISVYNTDIFDNDNFFDVFKRLYNRYHDQFLYLLVEGYNECKEYEGNSKLIDEYFHIIKVLVQDENIENSILNNIIKTEH